MPQHHEPNPEFVAHLEWQLRTALQRQERFSTPVRRERGGTMKLASVVLVSALMGAGGMAVKDEVQQSRAQEILLAQVETEIRLAELQVDAVGAQLHQIEARVEDQVEREDALLAARAAWTEATVHLERLRLDRDEIRVTGRAPDDALSAPLVDGRDFVRERLELELRVRDERLIPVQAQVARMARLRDAGIVPEQDVIQAQTGVRQATVDRDAIQERLDIRRRFVEGSVPGGEADAQAAMADAQRDLENQRLATEIVSLHLMELERRAADGLVREGDVRQARLAVMQAQLAQELAELRIQLLRSGGGA